MTILSQEKSRESGRFIKKKSRKIIQGKKGETSKDLFPKPIAKHQLLFFVSNLVPGEEM